MLTATEERCLNYIKQKALNNIKGKNFFTLTSVLQEAFEMTEDRAYEVLKNILARKTIRNTPDVIVYEYLEMLKKGYASIQEQVDIFGGDKISLVRNTSKIRMEKFKSGSFLDLVREVYKVEEEELLPLVGKYLETVGGSFFEYTINQSSFDEFIINDMDELEKQYNRYKND